MAGVAQALHLDTLGVYSGSLLGVAAVCHVCVVLARRLRPPPRAWLRLLEVATRTLVWFAISVSFTVVNKYFLLYWDSGGPHLGFRFALSTTTVHLIVKSVLSSATVRMRGRTGFKDNRCGNPALDARAKYRYAMPAGICTAFDIAMSNASLLFITVSFYTVVKSGSLGWTLVWAILLGLESCQLVKCGIVTLVVAGLVLATKGERGQPTFSPVGFALVSGASCLGGLRWCLAQALQRADDDCAHDAVLVVSHITPSGVVALLPVALFFEFEALADWCSATPAAGVRDAALIALLGGILGYVMLLVEVDLLRCTSSLTLAVFGAVKEMAQIALASATFGDRLSPNSLAGLGVVIGASALYALERAAARRADGDEAQAYEPVGARDDDDSDAVQSARDTADESAGVELTDNMSTLARSPKTPDIVW
ncbi:triose-phosphate transporter family-domain-containing protein [Pelagophyceae sp. CCMP2097]|nr:triose-phosphate transporter family-domain-containing protein [Pelagophyceae sp. CCMP2097]|mmetsp:Transcript_32788/g.113518  ORF Transcript_32788/g.113518 Transcript_32788/m.113518 type:complete len:425 (-) Transcript_32788:28-1302(-)